MAKIAVGSAVEAYFVKLGAMLLRHRSENGITTSTLFRRGGASSWTSVENQEKQRRSETKKAA
jgi:hypothetical protein